MTPPGNITGRRSPIGVAVSSSCIEAVQLERRGGKAALRDAVALTRLDPGGACSPREALRLAAVLRRRRFVGTDVVLALPDDRLVRGLVEVPHNAGDPIAAAARETERTHGLAAGSYELAAWRPELPRPGRQAAVCISGVRHADTLPWLEAFEAAGLSVNAMDTRACAISRVLPAGGAQDPSITMVLDVNDDAAELILLQRGDVVYQRSLPDAGLKTLIEALAEAGLEGDAAREALGRAGSEGEPGRGGARVGGALDRYTQALVREVEPALEYARRVYPDWPIERLAVVGEAGGVGGIEAALREALAMPGPVLLTSDESGVAEPRRLAVAYGMALYPRGAACAAA